MSKGYRRSESSRRSEIHLCDEKGADVSRRVLGITFYSILLIRRIRGYCGLQVARFISELDLKGPIKSV